MIIDYKYNDNNYNAIKLQDLEPLDLLEDTLQ